MLRLPLHDRVIYSRNRNQLAANCRPLYYREWEDSAMVQAMAAVEQGESLRQASQMFNVPRSTLHDRVIGKVQHGKKSGPSTYLSYAEEEELAIFLKKCADIGYPRTKTEVLVIIQQIVDSKGLEITVSNGWWQKFCLRNEGIALRTASSVSVARAMATDSESLNRYYDMLEDTLKGNGIFNNPLHIYNCDETGMPLNPKMPKVVAAVGSKNPHHIMGGTKSQITVLACTSATGSSMPPFIIFDNKTLNPSLTVGEIPGTLYGLSGSGWIDSELFLDWFRQHFLVYAPKARPLLLLMDGHSAHYCPQVIRAAAKEKIILFTLPSNTTHLTQPLDKGCFGPLKMYWRQICHDFYIRNPGQVITRYQFSSLFAQAWSQAMTTKNITASFKVTGVYPFNKYALSQLPKKEQTSFQPDQLSLQTGLAYIPMYSPALKVSRKLPNDDQNSENSVSSKLVSDISTHESHDVTAALLEASCSEENVVVKSLKEKRTVTTLSTAVSRFLETPTHPSKYPTKNPKSCGRVLTSLENMQKMEEKELEKQKKLQEKANRKALKELKLKDKTKVKGKKEDSKQNEVQCKGSKENDGDFKTKCTVQGIKSTRMQTRSQKFESSGQFYSIISRCMYDMYGLLFYIASSLKDKEASLDINNISYKSPKRNWWVKDLKLEISDRVSITAGRELSDKVINAAMLLMSKQYGQVDGLQDCTLGHYLRYTPVNQTLAIQIFYTGT